ncbi:MAG: hypothetical protein ABIH00_11490 [Armatimonadota bacterium]
MNISKMVTAKNELNGLDCFHTMRRYPRQLKANPVKYITGKIRESDFFPANIKKLAAKAEAAHKKLINAEIIMNIASEEEGLKTLTRLFNGKNPVNTAKVKKGYHIIKNKEIETFSKFKTEYLKWYKKFEKHPDSHPYLFNNLFGKDREKIITCREINSYLEKTYYNSTDGRWEISKS